MNLYVGSFQYGGGEGITQIPFDPETGRFGEGTPRDASLNAGNVLVRGNRLYATDERASHEGHPGGGVAAFAIDPCSGALEKLRYCPTFGVNPAGICPDSSGKYLLISHFSAGAPVVKTVKDEDGFHAEYVRNDTVTTLLKLDEEGIPEKIADVCVHRIKDGTKQPLIHQVFPDPTADRYAFCNLGTDEIWFLDVDRHTEKLSVRRACVLQDGCGPRHLVFHPSGKWLYCNYERHPFISQFACGEKALLHLRDTGVLAEGEVMRDDCNESEILVNAAGDRLYNLMRGVGSLTVFSIKGESGELSLLQRVYCASRMPRCAALTPDGNWLLVADTDAEVLESFRILEDGTVERAAVSGHLPHPAGIAFSK